MADYGIVIFQINSRSGYGSQSQSRRKKIQITEIIDQIITENRGNLEQISDSVANQGIINSSGIILGVNLTVAFIFSSLPKWQKILEVNDYRLASLISAQALNAIVEGGEYNGQSVALHLARAITPNIFRNELNLLFLNRDIRSINIILAIASTAACTRLNKVDTYIRKIANTDEKEFLRHILSFLVNKNLSMAYMISEPTLNQRIEASDNNAQRSTHSVALSLHRGAPFLYEHYKAQNKVSPQTALDVNKSMEETTRQHVTSRDRRPGQ